MAGQKIDHEFNVYEDHIGFLEEMAEKYDLPDADKALRVVMDYVREEGDLEDIFTQVRCLHC